MAVTTVYGIRRAGSRPFVKGLVRVSDAEADTYGSTIEAAEELLGEIGDAVTEAELLATDEGRAAVAAFQQRDDDGLLAAEGRAEREAFIQQTT
jgi:dsDNA-binding SOS-regulon protein